MKILTILGARPQFIKAAAVSRVLRQTKNCQEILVHTGQHYDYGMSEVFFRELEIQEPAYNLGIGSGNHGMQTGRMLEGIEEILLREQPDWVLVYGDTNSTLAGALAASKLRIPLAHVEAGLRSFNRDMPEEINRVVSDHIADILFAPTIIAVANLANEGIFGESVHEVGDVMYDVALFYSEKARAESGILRHLEVKAGGYILATVHRAENVDDPVRLHTILDGLCRVANELPVVLPLHPRARKMLTGDIALKLERSGVLLVDPVGYLDMVMLELNAKAIATDSGGVQKEAFFHKVPCVTLRSETEWVELVEMGWNTLVTPNDVSRICNAILNAQKGKSAVRAPYGTGNSAHLVAAALMR
ncbi:MAG: non-hydrolyzing UDP-N-acetylglucosamine 2-epimerase [Gammaproteobacteria bacterium]